jgi:hypothetical protein
MLTIQCTKKLAEELKVNKSKITPTDSDKLFSWHAHLFLFNRRKYVLVMNNMTRYNFVLDGLKKAEFKVFDEVVVKAIAENLLADGVDKITIEKYLQRCGSISYTSTSDRSIISQVNEMIMMTKIQMENDRVDGIETNIYELNRWLNRFVMLKLPKAFSGETMREALRSL